MTNKKSMAGKMVSKEYKTVRCGSCGKFGHHHSTHRASDITGKGTFEMTGHPQNEPGSSYRLGYTSNPSAFRKHSQGWRPNDISHKKIK